MVSGVAESKNYAEVMHKNKTKTMLTHIVLKVAVMKFSGYFHHTYYPPPLSSVTWTLDYGRTSDYVDSVGYWHVAPHPDAPKTKSRLYYSVNLIPADFVPEWIVNILQKQALGQATAWVKYESEKRARKAALGAGAGGQGGSADDDSAEAGLLETLAALAADNAQVIASLVLGWLAMSLGRMSATGAGARRVVLDPSNENGAVGPPSATNRATVHGGVVYASGQVATQLLRPGKAGGAAARGRVNFKDEARCVLRNLVSALEDAGSDSGRVLRVECLLADMADYVAFNEVYAEFFSDPAIRPARVCFAVKGLPLGARVEVAATAFV